MIHTYIRRDFDIGIQTVSQAEDGGERILISRTILEPLIVVSNRANLVFETAADPEGPTTEECYGWGSSPFVAGAGTNPVSFEVGTYGKLL